MPESYSLGVPLRGQAVVNRALLMQFSALRASILHAFARFGLRAPLACLVRVSQLERVSGPPMLASSSNFDPRALAWAVVNVKINAINGKHYHFGGVEAYHDRVTTWLRKVMLFVKLCA